MKPADVLADAVAGCTHHAHKKDGDFRCCKCGGHYIIAQGWVAGRRFGPLRDIHCKENGQVSVTIEITPEGRPRIFELLTALTYAMGAVNRFEPARTSFRIPARFEPELDAMEDRIEHLTNQEIETFVDGEESEVAAIAGRSYGLTKAHELLEAMFDGEESTI
jgi:hypothetical protein